MTDDRPSSCCGVCPPLLRGGFDCTCAGNPRCERTWARTAPRTRGRLDRFDIGMIATAAVLVGGGVIAWMILGGFL